MIKNHEKRRKGKIVFYGMIFASVLFICTFLLAGRFLVVNEKPEKADVIIILSGDKGRLEKGVDLFRMGYADKVMVTRTDGSGGIPTEMIEQSGLPMSSFIPEKNATSTYTNAVETKAIMNRLGMKSALIISSNYHMRRVKLTFEHVFSGTNVKLAYIAAESPQYNPFSWWSSKNQIRYTVLEYFKLVGYIVEFLDK